MIKVEVVTIDESSIGKLHAGKLQGSRFAPWANLEQLKAHYFALMKYKERFISAKTVLYLTTAEESQLQKTIQDGSSCFHFPSKGFSAA